VAARPASPRDAQQPLSERDVAAFVDRVVREGRARYRDLPWRRTRDPYAVLISEVMLQQTQVPRVLPRYERWLERFPTLDSLAAAPLAEVLAEWQGLGYNRRAIALKRLAEEIETNRAGVLPEDERELRALPGIGPATAAGLMAFAFGRPAVYLETNVRAVVIHELFADVESVPDRDIRPILSAALDVVTQRDIAVRDWYYALLDYGAGLKKELPNPSRRSAHHTRQSPYEGSRRQKRARVLRAALELGEAEEGSIGELAELSPSDTADILEALAADGFVVREGDRWRVAE